MDERHPLDLAVLGELRDVERAGIEQVHVRGAVVGIECAARHELVDVVEALVVAEIEDDASVLRHDRLGAFVLDAAERGALLRHRIRIHRIDLDDPAEAVRLVRLLADVEAVVVARPFVGALRHAVALVVLRLGVIGGELAGEIAVKILLRRDVGAPGRHAAGAVVDRAEHLHAARVGAGLQAVVAGGRTGDLHFGVGGDATVVGRVGHHLPFAVDLADFDDRVAVRRHLDVDLLLGERRRLDDLLSLLLDDRDDAGEHELRVGVFVVHQEQTVLRRSFERDEADEVVVVAELPALLVGRLCGRVERRRVGEERIAPPEQHVGVVALGDVVVGVDAGGRAR